MTGLRAGIAFTLLLTWIGSADAGHKRSSACCGNTFGPAVPVGMYSAPPSRAVPGWNSAGHYGSAVYPYAGIGAVPHRAGVVPPVSPGCEIVW